MSVVTLALLLLTLFGHTALWVGYVNRIHSLGLPRWQVKILTAPGPLMFVLLPLVAIYLWMHLGISQDAYEAGANRLQWIWCYILPCWAIAGITVGLWILRHLSPSRRSAVRTDRTTVVDVAAELGYKPVAGLPGRIAARIPGNQALQLAVRRIELEIPRLPSSLDGFSITLLSDLHYTGHIGLEYYQAVIREANLLKSDLIAVCGDIVDDLKYLAWLPETLGKLTAQHGVYCILGNHDMFTHAAPQIRQALAAHGLNEIGGRWQSLNIGAAEIILAGNELPWLKPAADMRSCPPRSADKTQFRVLLSHSPDQLPWARRWDFDFMMAGHTHGGQFCAPLIGPICCPSWHGVKYAAGAHQVKPTVLFVSRGIAAETPLRLFCRPEVTKIIFRSRAPKIGS